MKHQPLLSRCMTCDNYGKECNFNFESMLVVRITDVRGDAVALVQCSHHIPLGGGNIPPSSIRGASMPRRDSHHALMDIIRVGIDEIRRSRGEEARTDAHDIRYVFDDELSEYDAS